MYFPATKANLRCFEDTSERSGKEMAMGTEDEEEKNEELEEEQEDKMKICEGTRSGGVGEQWDSVS